MPSRWEVAALAVAGSVILAVIADILKRDGVWSLLVICDYVVGIALLGRIARRKW